MLAGVAGVEGFFLALSLAFTAGRAALSTGFRGDGRCEGGGDVFDILGLTTLGATFNRSCRVLVIWTRY